MTPPLLQRLSGPVGWVLIGVAMVAPIVIAAFSPYLAYRNLAYIVGGFAGIVCLSLFLLQPILPAGYLAGTPGPPGRRWHRWLGFTIVAAVALHVGGLYLASPEDTLDALTLASPTPFSVYGVIAMWGILATALLVVLRRRIGWRASIWKLVHHTLALLVVVATCVHALQIEGAMEQVSKWLLCIAVILAALATFVDLRLLRRLKNRRAKTRDVAGAGNR